MAKGKKKPSKDSKEAPALDRGVVFNALYDGDTTSKDGIKTVKLRTTFDQMPQYIRLCSLIAQALNLRVAIKNVGVENLGECRIKAISIKREGDAVIQFTGPDMITDKLRLAVGQNITAKVMEIDEG